jgi:hypothetical protein
MKSNMYEVKPACDKSSPARTITPLEVIGLPLQYSCNATAPAAQVDKPCSNKRYHVLRDGKSKRQTA